MKINRTLTLAIASALMLTSGEVTGQTVFEWTDSKTDVAQYQFVEKCLALSFRLRDSVSRASGVLADTFEMKKGAENSPLDPGIVENVKSCVSKFDVTSIPATQVVMSHKAFLIAGMHLQAESVIRVHMNRLQSLDSNSRAALLDSTLVNLFDIPPFNFGTSLKYLADLESDYPAYRPSRMLILYSRALYAAVQADSLRYADDFSDRILKTAKLVAPNMSTPEDIASLTLSVMVATKYRLKKDLIDSLAIGTDRYAYLLKNSYHEITGLGTDNMPAGNDAPKITGNHWFPAGADKQEYPAKGRVSLVWFNSAQVGGFSTWMAANAYVARMLKRFPELNLIIVSGTKGHFGPLEPPSKDREAILIDSLFRKFLGFERAVVSVTENSYVTLSSPDGRKVYFDGDNFDNYAAVDPALQSGGFYIVDENRKIVDKVQISRLYEDDAVQIIQTVIDRSKRKATAAQ